MNTLFNGIIRIGIMLLLAAAIQSCVTTQAKGQRYQDDSFPRGRWGLNHQNGDFR